MANLLTALRILLIAPFVAALLLEGGRAFAFGMFVVAALTDLADGYIARARNEVTTLGAALDPIADKALVAAALLLLAADRSIAGSSLVAATIILVREFAVSGLREAAADGGDPAAPVTLLSKLKSVVQFAALGAYLAAPLSSLPLYRAADYALWLAAILAAWTGADHGRKLLAKLSSRTARPSCGISRD